MDDLLQKAQELTSIEEYDGIFFKRDDLFRPFDGEALNGGKLRQAINLIAYNLEQIRHDYKGKVATMGAVDSPQGLIVTRVANYYDLKSIVFYGNIGDAIKENQFIRHTRYFGGEVESILGIAFNNRLLPAVEELRDYGSGNNFFLIKFGINIEEYPYGVDCIADQVQNLPNDIENLVIPVGSGITAGSILRGLVKYKKKIPNIYVIHVSGRDRVPDIREISGEDIDFEYDADKKYPHHKKVKRNITDDFQLDQIYEAKIYEWMLRKVDYKNEKTVFWVVGNANFYR
jgi:1-aminocyclopropane-1-carboxylate deaminase/D-cysteine desulfhydrase-like pyridoxal-dependent ACC family enzyme